MQAKGQIAFALQQDNKTLPAAPTHALRVKQFLDPMPKFKETTDEIATGNRFSSAAPTVQGVDTANQQIRATATTKEIIPLLTALLAAPDPTGLITPRPDNFSAGMPGQPLAIWQKHVLMNALFPGAQLSGITFNMPNRDFVEVSATINTTRVEEFDPATVVMPPIPDTEMLQFMHWYLKIDDVIFAPESGSIEISQELSASDGARGLDAENRMYVLGWDNEGELKGVCKFKINEAGAQEGGSDLLALLAKAKPNAASGQRVRVKAETGFEIAGKKYVFNIPVAELRATEIPNGLGKIVLGLELNALGLGVPPFTVQVPAA